MHVQQKTIDRVKYAIYPDSATHTPTQRAQYQSEFMEWWQQTSWFVERARLTLNRKNAMSWDSDRRTSAMWKEAIQVALWETGEPKILCRHCDAAYAHPAASRTGTGNMNLHLKKAHARPDAEGIEQGESSNLVALVEVRYTLRNLLGLLTGTASEEGRRTKGHPALLSGCV